MWTNTPLVNRRDMLKRSAAGFGTVALSSLLARTASAFTAAFPTAHFAPKAKRVIFLFMNGGPCHLDTFDPKPALQKYAGQQPDASLYKKSKGSGYLPSPL